MCTALRRDYYIIWASLVRASRIRFYTVYGTVSETRVLWTRRRGDERSMNELRCISCVCLSRKEEPWSTWRMRAREIESVHEA